MKVIINSCYGGFSLSDKAFEELIKLGFSVGNREDQDADIIKWDSEYYIKFSGSKYCFGKIEDYSPEFRSDPRLVEVIENLGDEANTKFSELKVVEIPDDLSFSIEEYDGIEHIAEIHRTWY